MSVTKSAWVLLMLFGLWLWTWLVLICNGAGAIFRQIDRWVDALISRLCG